MERHLFIDHKNFRLENLSCTLSPNPENKPYTKYNLFYCYDTCSDNLENFDEPNNLGYVKLISDNYFGTVAPLLIQYPSRHVILKEKIKIL